MASTTMRSVNGGGAHAPGAAASRPPVTANSTADTLLGSNPTQPQQPQNKKKKKKNFGGAKLITPNKVIQTDLDRRMSVEKGVIDELLLICGVIGTTTSGEGDDEQLIPVTDCLNWLQDLQRALRRDDDLYRPISLLIGKWNVVQQKLLPLIMTCKYDTSIVLTVIKILVILTKPLAENTKRAARVIIDTKKTSPLIIQEQIKLRDNAIQQAELLLQYKHTIVYHPSHHKKDKKTGEKTEGKGLMSVLVSLLAEPLSKSGTARTETDHLTIELVLHLVRNFLAAEPLLKSKLFLCVFDLRFVLRMVCLLSIVELADMRTLLLLSTFLCASFLYHQILLQHQMK